MPRSEPASSRAELQTRVHASSRPPCRRSDDAHFDFLLPRRSLSSYLFYFILFYYPPTAPFFYRRRSRSFSVIRGHCSSNISFIPLHSVRYSVCRCHCSSRFLHCIVQHTFFHQGRIALQFGPAHPGGSFLSAPRPIRLPPILPNLSVLGETCLLVDEAGSINREKNMSQRTEYKARTSISDTQ